MSAWPDMPRARDLKTRWPETTVPAFAGTVCLLRIIRSAAHRGRRMLRPTSSLQLSSWPSFLPSPCWLSSCRV